LREALSAVDGVSVLSFDLVARRVTIDHELGESTPLAAAIRSVGMHPSEVADDDQAMPGARRAVPRRTLIEMIVVSWPFIGSG